MTDDSETTADPKAFPARFENLPAPAKLNLFLHVVGRRPDGKHLLQSVFTLVDLCDELSFEEAPSGEILRTGDLLCEPELDLCVKAARALERAAGVRRGAAIFAKKRIPAGAGLGGGSSDAATTLIALNRLWRTGLTRAELMAVGETVGADVPFFIWGRTGFVEGIGERISPFDLPAARYRIVWPGKPVSTREIFNSPCLTRDNESRRMAVFSDFIRRCWPELPGRNDLQPAVESLEPAVSAALEALSLAGERPRMTGSGSAVFSAHPLGKPLEPLEGLPKSWRQFIACGLERHPLAGWL